MISTDLDGIFISVIGVDGAGKTTLINSLSSELEALKYEVKVRHLRPSLFPALATIFKREKVAEKTVVTNPHGSLPSGLLGSFLRLIYLLMDYSLGYWIVVKPAIRRPSVCFMFDRYFYDLTMDPLRFRIKLPLSVLKMASSCLPKPDIVFCLFADAQLIADRKPELSKDEIVEQYERLRLVTQSHPYCVWIDTSVGVSDSVCNCLTEIRKFLDLKASN